MSHGGGGVSEEVRAKRIAKRVEGVSAVQRSTAYIIASLHCSELPQAPYPYDTTVSKRSWEKSMMAYRRALKDALRQIHSEAATHVSDTYDD